MFLFKDFCVEKSNKMDLVGLPKTKGAWNFQNGQSATEELTKKKGLYKRQPFLGQENIVTGTLWNLCDFSDLSVSGWEALWARWSDPPFSFHRPGSLQLSAHLLPLCPAPDLTSFLYCFAQALEMVASCIRQNSNSWVCNCVRRSCLY